MELERKSKKFIIAKHDKMQEIAQRYMRLSIVVAAELYRHDPGALPFVDGTFVPDSVGRVRAAFLLKYDGKRLRSRRHRFARWMIRKLIPVRKQKSQGGASSETVG